MRVRMRQILNSILLSLAVAIVFFVIWVFSPFADAGMEGVIGGVAQIVMALATIGFGIYVTTKSAFPWVLRRAWGLITLGNIFGVLGQIVGTYLLVATDATPFPSLADAFYFLSYPLAFAGILLLPYAATRREQRLLLNIDISILMLVCAVFLWHFIVGGLIERDANGLAGLISIAYPFGDLLLLTGMVSLIQRDVEGVRRKILITLIGSMLSFILGDVMFAFLGGYTGELSNTLWKIDGSLFLIARFGFLAATIWQASESQFDFTLTETFSPLLRTNLVYIAVLSSTGLAFVVLTSLLLSNFRSYITIIGTIGITMLVLIRQYFVLQDNRRLKEEVERLAVTDSLTGIPNRRFFERILAREIAHARRYNRALSLLLIDVDNFKKYNDRHGHLEGDRLLQEVAKLLAQQIRASDLVARYGGDEFVIILPETNLEMASRVAEKLQRAVKKAASLEETLGISIGRAAFQNDMTADTLLELADQDMYRNKPHYAGR